MFTPTEWLACASWGLLSWHGSDLKLVSTSLDPYKPKREEAPSDILAPLQEAEAQLNAATDALGEAESALERVENELKTFQRQWGNVMGGLNEKGQLQLKALLLDVEVADRQWTQALALVRDSRSEQRSAENNFNNWFRAERQRRERDAQPIRKQEVKKAPLRDRLAAFVGRSVSP